MSNAFDSTNAPTTEPVEIPAGDFVQWNRNDIGTDYPNTEYTLKYTARLEGAGDNAKRITITAAADGDDYLVQLDTTTTGAYTIGAYQWVAQIERNSDQARITLDDGRWTVTANKTDSASDPRGHNQIMVDNIKAALEGRATNKQLDVLSYSLGVDSSATRDTTQLLKFLTTYEARLIAENRRKRARQGKSHSGAIKVRL